MSFKNFINEEEPEDIEEDEPKKCKHCGKEIDSNKTTCVHCNKMRMFVPPSWQG